MADWRLDEGVHAGCEHLDPDYVAGYERKAGFDPADDIDVLRRHGLTTDSVVVDMGAGTGVFTAAVAPLCRKVIGRRRLPGHDRRVALPRRTQRLGQRELDRAGFLSI
jgi:hypothetical protein